jgi:inosose dehydratase
MNHLVGTTKVALNPLSWYLTEDGYRPQLAPPLPEILRQVKASGLHRHVGTLIETPGETARALAEIDARPTFAGADTGHLAWAGADPAQFIHRYPDRVGAVHLKDVHLGWRRRGGRRMKITGR